MKVNRRRCLALIAAALLPADAHADALTLAELPGNLAAPDFALSDLGGHVHRLADYRGRPLLVSFWAVWCPPCRRELAALADLRKQLAETRIEVLAVNLGDSTERIRAFLTDHPAPGLPILLDDDKRVAAAWHVRGLPVAYALTSDGILRLGALGERDWRSPAIAARLRALR